MFSNIFTIPILLLSLAWVGYCALHSLLASRFLKTWVTRRWPAYASHYRLAYNLLATVLLLPLLLATEFAANDWLWRWQGAWAWVAHGASLLVLIGFVWTSRAYDMKQFMGLATSSPGAPARLGLSPLHRFVRHPWYFLGLVWLWTRDMDSARLAAALIITGYLWLGSRLEEWKLLEELGPAYREYHDRVPGLLPRPWRYLSREAFARLRDQRPPSNASMT